VHWLGRPVPWAFRTPVALATVGPSQFGPWPAPTIGCVRARTCPIEQTGSPTAGQVATYRLRLNSRIADAQEVLRRRWRRSCYADAAEGATRVPGRLRRLSWAASSCFSRGRGAARPRAGSGDWRASGRLDHSDRLRRQVRNISMGFSVYTDARKSQSRACSRGSRVLSEGCG